MFLCKTVFKNSRCRKEFDREYKFYIKLKLILIVERVKNFNILCVCVCVWGGGLYKDLRILIKL